MSVMWNREDAESPFMPQLREIVLERLRVDFGTPVVRELIENATVEERRRTLYHVADAMILGMSAHVLADRLPPEVVRERRTFRWNVPASGWQQWKASHGALWLPRWFMRRWPVRFVEHVHDGEVTVKLDRFWTFPESTVRLPELGRPVRLAQWDVQTHWTEQ